MNNPFKDTFDKQQLENFIQELKKDPIDIQKLNKLINSSNHLKCFYNELGNEYKKYFDKFLYKEITISEIVNKAFMNSLENLDPYCLSIYVRLGADINQLDSNGNTPLIIAIYKNNPEVVKMLIDNGVDVNAKNSKNSSPLIVAESEFDKIDKKNRYLILGESSNRRLTNINEIIKLLRGNGAKY